MHYLCMELQPDAAEAFKSAKEAYEVLSDPQQRQQYNQQRTRQVNDTLSCSTKWTMDVS